MTHALREQLLVRLPRLAGDALPLCPELLARAADSDAENLPPALAAVTQLLDDGVLNQSDDYFYPGCTFLDYVAWGKLGVARPTAADHHAVDRALVAWSGKLSGLRGHRFADVIQQLGRDLIHIDNPDVVTVGPGVNLQHIFHRRDKLRVCLGWDTPLLYPPRLEFVFFSVWCTVSCEIASTYSKATMRSASSRRVQRPAPSGGVLQARAIRWASPTPSRARSYWRQGAFRCNAASTPSCMAVWRTRATVTIPTSNAA